MQRQKKLMMNSCWKIVTSLPLFQLMANLEQFGRGVPEHGL